MNPIALALPSQRPSIVNETSILVPPWASAEQLQALRILHRMDVSRFPFKGVFRAYADDDRLRDADAAHRTRGLSRIGGRVSMVFEFLVADRNAQDQEIRIRMEASFLTTHLSEMTTRHAERFVLESARRLMSEMITHELDECILLANREGNLERPFDPHAKEGTR